MALIASCSSPVELEFIGGYEREQIPLDFHTEGEEASVQRQPQVALSECA